MKKIDLRYVFSLLLVLDLCFSFVQHYHKSLDGDMASIILGYPEVMHDPLGLDVLLDHQVYGGTNRFFAHWSMSAYFKNTPQLFQFIVSPIESIYFSCALAKTIIQLIIIICLAWMVIGAIKIWDEKFLLAAILIAPIFQTNGYNGYMGIISSSITYTFFYSLQLALLLLYFLPFHNRLSSHSWTNLSAQKCILLLLFSFVLTLGGPLNPAIILIGCCLILFNCWRTNFSEHTELPIIQNSISSFKQIPKQLLFLFVFICLLSFYSLFLGLYNAENFFHTIPLLERYKLLPAGLYYPFTQKLGLPLLLAMILLNIFFISRHERNEKRNEIIKQVKWILLFVVIYILILPLGGYREYRPNIVRGDTLLPVIVCMIYFYGISTLYLLKQFQSKFKKLYSGGLAVFLLIFVIADKSITKENDCEKNALEQIAQSTEKVVALDNNCTVMSWTKMTDSNNSKLNCELLLKWGIINKEKYYFQN